MNFCVAILILKTEEKNILGILCFIISRKVKDATETQKKICVVYGEGAVTNRMRQKWFAKFHAGDFSLDHAPWSGRPVDSDQIETFIEKINVIPRGR